MAKRLPAAKRAKRANPRMDRNNHDNILDFASFEPNTRKGRRSAKFGQNQTDTSTGPTLRKPSKVDLIPRNMAQENYIDNLVDLNNDVVFGIGPAGTGKTMLATQYAINSLIAGEIKKIVITRPAVSVDEQHGFLPGDLNAKLAPWTRPIIDVFNEIYGVQTVEKMLALQIIEIAPLAYMRGRTFKDSIIIADEMQNATPSQMKMLLTRIGDGSRMFVTGDLFQHDRGFDCNGLKDFCQKLTSKGGSDLFAICEFGTGDIERHRAVGEALRIYGED